ncbi:CRISPR-associated RAMP protein, Csm4 family [Rhodothermus marinus SG0.5JP17-172]|uniref:type III-A CRISPR-associated RAMP protein Csm4 n=1 Tax=Rhodothermus marinus TaxID=29549 RepID=UPI000223DB56|nr:type III-A CRISPR-associated RAMP protein Csm4 [Rhodothermus marinus]AEN73097.1 CRISPR-associated RAMP protein, Csm4 family [Rhodothermus marinus SG0.5JP17-172]
MNLLGYRLQFPNGLHVAAEGFGEESVSPTVPSDTLFSAVCVSAFWLYGAEGVERLLKPGAVRLSSTFPFVGTEYFFPRPLSFFPKIPNEQYELLKRIKKVRYLSRTLFEQVLEGTQPEIRSDQIRGLFWFAGPPPDEPVMQTEVRPRVALDRVTQASEIYHFAEVHFNPRLDAGLFFLAQFEDPKVQQLFESALALLADEGIGADRTMGKGWFRWEREELTIRVPEATDRAVLLSLYNPTPEEAVAIAPYDSCYALVTRRGWVTVPGAMTLRRRPVRFFAEGSVLRFISQHMPQGRLVVVLSEKDAPELTHPVYRNGQALALPIR